MALIQSQKSESWATRGAGATETGRPLRRFDFRAMGTPCSIQFAAVDEQQAQSYEQAALNWVQTFEARYTRFRDDSLVGQINLSAGSWVEVDAEMDRMLDMCGTVHFLTQGIVDVTAGPLAKLWDYHVSHPRLPTDNEVRAAKQLVGWNLVERKAGWIRLPYSGMSLDLGGWGKEFAVDHVAGMAAEFGLDHVLVDFGHDLKAMGFPPGRPAWHVGLEDPTNPGGLWGSIAALNCAVASSGDYQRGFTINGQRYGHIIDPRNGRPATHGLRQVTVVAPTCLQAGILATTAFVLGPEAGLDLIQETMGAEGCMVSTYAKHQTRGFFQYVVN
jgi:thiamine biosynthesis lipoprotein